MALDLWFREDVVRILAGTHETMRCALAAAFSVDQELDVHHLAFTDGYEQGLANALRALRLSFGLANPDGPSGTQGWRPESSFLVQAPPEELNSNPAGGWILNHDGRERG